MKTNRLSSERKKQQDTAKIYLFIVVLDLEIKLI